MTWNEFKAAVDKQLTEHGINGDFDALQSIDFDSCSGEEIYIYIIAEGNFGCLDIWN